MVLWNVRVRDKGTDELMLEGFYTDKATALHIEDFWDAGGAYDVSITAISVK